MASYTVMLYGRTANGKEIQSVRPIEAESPDLAAWAAAKAGAPPVWDNLETGREIVRLRVSWANTGEFDRFDWFPFNLDVPADEEVDARGLIGVDRCGYGLGFVVLTPDQDGNPVRNTGMIDIHPGVLPGIVVDAADPDTDDRHLIVRWDGPTVTWDDNDLYAG